MSQNILTVVRGGPDSPAPPWRKRLLKTFITLTGIYSVGVLLFLAVRLLIGDGWALVVMVNNFFPFLLLPAFLLLPLTLFLGRWRLALSLVPPVVVFVVAYGVFFTDRTAEVDPDAIQVTVATYNLHAAWVEMEPLAEVIRALDADVVALQEVSFPAAEFLGEALDDLYPHQAWHPHDFANAGQGLLSRHPVLEDEYWHNEELRYATRGHQRVELDVDGLTLTIYNTHPSSPLLYKDPISVLTGRGHRPDIHERAISDLLDRAASDSGPVLIVGDLNMTDQSGGYQRLSARYTDIHREVGWGMGFTYPDWSHPGGNPDLAGLALPPFIRLDYIFHSDDVQGVDLQVWPTAGGSDHRPVLARLALPSTGE